MKAVLVGAVNYLFLLFVRVSPIHFIASLVIFFLLNLMIQAVFMFLPNWINLNGVFSYLTPEMWFFLDLLNINLGAPLMITAFVTRFLIRRIPIVG